MQLKILKKEMNFLTIMDLVLMKIIKIIRADVGQKIAVAISLEKDPDGE